MANSVFTSAESFFEAEEGRKQRLPYSEDTSVLGEEVKILGRTAKNRLVCQAMEGCDGERDGRPGELTLRRYKRFAEGGAGIIWFEATACMEKARANPRQLWLTEENIDSFSRALDMIRETAVKATGKAPLIIMQDTHSGRYSKPNGVPEPIIAYNNPVFEKDKPIAPSRIITDDELDSVRDALVHSAVLAEKAGFDGADIKCCHRYLDSELLSAYTREGRYGGSFENRTRLIRESTEGALQSCGRDFIVTTRMNAYDGFPYPYGFGVNEGEGLTPDFTEAKKLVRELYSLGVRLCNITMGNPYVNPHVNRPYAVGGYIPDEEPIFGVERMLFGIEEIKRDIPEMLIISSALTFLGEVSPNVAAGFVKEGGFDFAGYGRMIFAYPDFARDILDGRGLKKEKLCVACSKCTELMRAGLTPGCVVRDGVYRDIYREYKAAAAKKN